MGVDAMIGSKIDWGFVSLGVERVNEKWKF